MPGCRSKVGLGRKSVLQSPFYPYSLTSHVVEVEVCGPAGGDGSCFSVKTVRNNPAASGVVTGKQTYSSFLSSLLGV